MPQRIIVWNRGAPLRLWIESADLMTHRGIEIPPSSVIGGSLIICEQGTTEPPVPLTTRLTPLSVVYDVPMSEYGVTIPYGADLQARTAVRVIMSLVFAGVSDPQRVLDASAVFQNPQGLE
jgi:hypothetical protein